MKHPRWAKTVSTELPENAGHKVRRARLDRMAVTEDRALTAQLVSPVNRVIEVHQVAMANKVIRERLVHKVLKAQRVVLDREEMPERASAVWKVFPVCSVNQVWLEELEIPDVKEIRV